MSQFLSRRNRTSRMWTMVMCLVIIAFEGVNGNSAPAAPPRSLFRTQQTGNYASVKQQCINAGGSIASIRSAAEDTQAKSLCGSGACLIGFTDMAKEGNFRWDDNSPVGYYNWHPPSEPNNSQGKEDCTVLNWGSLKKWNDVPCDRAGYYGICQTSATLEQYTCPPGTYDKSPPTEPGCVCEECPAGHFCEGGDAGKEECHKGYFQPLKGQSACEPSPKGHKVPNTGAEHPTACPAGKYQDEMAQEDCKQCPKGNFCPGTANENPTECARGTYQDERGEDSCKLCPKGNKCPGFGNKEPTQCWNGQFQHREGKQVCNDCLIGNKCPGEGNEDPTPCDANTFQPCTGQETCIPCEAPDTSGAGAGSCSAPTTI